MGRLRGQLRRVGSDLLVGEELSDFSLELLSAFFVAKLVLCDDSLEIEVRSDHISGGHQVVVVHVLHESLHLGSSLDFL